MTNEFIEEQKRMYARAQEEQSRHRMEEDKVRREQTMTGYSLLEVYARSQSEAEVTQGKQQEQLARQAKYLQDDEAEYRRAKELGELRVRKAKEVDEAQVRRAKQQAEAEVRRARQQEDANAMLAEWLPEAKVRPPTWHGDATVQNQVSRRAELWASIFY